MIRIVALGVSVLLFVSTGFAKQEKELKPMEMVDGHAILALPVSGFESLSLDDKLLAYHLYQSAIIGRDISFDQNHRYNLAIRALCEQILLHSKGVDPTVLKEIATYLKMQYINVGIYGKLTFAKFLPPKALTFKKLSDAAEKAKKNGAQVPVAVSDLEKIIFDPTFEMYNTTRSPKPGDDLITGSAINFYDRGITWKEVDGFKDKYPLNSKIVQENGKLGESVWRAGDPKQKIPAGLYAEKIEAMIQHMEAALPHASKENAKSLQLLIDYYRTGNNETFNNYNIAWLKYDQPTIDIIHGFIEEYRDPREKKGAWEGMVFFINEKTSGWLRQVAAKADEYEKHTPFDEKYKRTGVKPIANLVEVLIETGDAGPISWSGVNLPNDQRIRQKYGSKDVLLWNAREAKEKVGGEKLIHEFVWPEDQEIVSKHASSGIEVLVGFHEALGHASGKQSDKLKGAPRDHLPGYYSWLEEERADLLALHHAWDAETFKIRRDWNEEAAKALYKRYPTMEMLNLAELPEGATAIEEPHAVGGNFAVHYLMKKSKAIEEVERKVGGQKKTFWVVRDENIPKMREGVAELLRELQRIKSEGDLEAIKKLAAEYGATQFDANLAKEVRERKKRLHIPSYYAFVFPSMTLVEKDGKPADVQLGYPKDFLRQQMSWSGYTEAELSKLPKGM